MACIFGLVSSLSSEPVSVALISGDSSLIMRAPLTLVPDPDAEKAWSTVSIITAEIQMKRNRIKNITPGEYLKLCKKQVGLCDFCVKPLYIVADHLYASLCPVSERTDIITVDEHLLM